MVEAVKIWNEPNNLSHWDFTIDKDWKEFATLTRLGAEAIRSLAPETIVLFGGISPIDPNFISLMVSYGVLDCVDAIGVHGFPLDWNHWQINNWPDKIKEIEDVSSLPVWVTEVGASSFGAEEVQVFGLQRTMELLIGRVPRIYWYSLLDLPPAWEATTRHKESEGSSYYRHFYMGLIRSDGTAKPALEKFDNNLGICQWFHFNDPRLKMAVKWLKEMGIKKLRTGISWADWHRPDAIRWFDYQMNMLADFDTTVTLCFTPPSCGKVESITSPPKDPRDFANFVKDITERYIVGKEWLTKEFSVDEPF